MEIGIGLAILAAGAAQIPLEREGWQMRHQPDRNSDRVMMEAHAGAEDGPARLSLYCDTDNGFRVMVMPRRALMPEGPVRLTFRIDGAAPVTLSGQAFGDDTTDVITVYGTAPIQAALARARQVRIAYAGGAGASGQLRFTFAGLPAGAPTVMAVCPVR